MDDYSHYRRDSTFQSYLDRFAYVTGHVPCYIPTPYAFPFALLSNIVQEYDIKAIQHFLCSGTVVSPPNAHYSRW